MTDIDTIFKKAAGLKIAVIGDLIEDRYIIGGVDRISPEAPVPVVIQSEDRICLGGAGNVMANLHNVGVDVDLYCNYNSSSIYWYRESLEMGSGGNIFINKFPHSVKTRIMAGQYHIVRVDNELRQNEIEWLSFKSFSWYDHLEKNFEQYDAIVLADYHKGVLSDSLINAVVELAMHYDIPVIVDAKRDFDRFKGCTIVKCNRKEFESYYEIQSLKYSVVSPPNHLVERLRLHHFIVTNGKSGISSYGHGMASTGVDGIPMDVVDTCGAGDTVTAMIALMKCITDDIEDILKISNIAASQVCKHVGVYPITQQDLKTHVGQRLYK
jgi:D-beta-D-heptose 7-phosphate kinase/D-beta-D-heptose 1-phosphate adenosyltransferase